ncbi:TetR/AcrR family transcriptional regulator [Novosphingobium sp. KCTC 2891]|uniref:TetR/AcrR family transcriptional regulator n=1 Tax=Novosphingobium sp. KCTC 2891 TaxID=2989730 RepID=UPI00222274FD|nr:TetR/AcrR family transcriptional regulator [Novosphingobium sp. KCTC 2891]MCW1383652.1 TetR/AcrR family transcriptional regulator [Novosphingobium sp. KCTC 2891]
MRIQRTSRQESRAQTRERLLTAARAEFALRGIGAASIDRISESAGFSRGAFYANYAGKHEVVLELLEQHQTREIEAWQGLLDAEGSLAEVLPRLRDRFDAFAHNTEDLLFMAELQLEAMRNPDLAERYRSYAREIEKRTLRLAEAFIVRAGGSRVSADLLGKALQSFSPQLIAESRLGLGQDGVSAGERLVAIITELLGTRS